MDDTELKKMVKEIHCVIVGDISGTPGLLERVRNLEYFKKTVSSFFKAATCLIVTNLFAIATAVVLFCIKIN